MNINEEMMPKFDERFGAAHKTGRKWRSGFYDIGTCVPLSGEVSLGMVESLWLAKSFGQYLVRTAMGGNPDVESARVYSFSTSAEDYVHELLIGMSETNLWKYDRKLLSPAELEASRNPYDAAAKSLRESDVDIVDARGWDFEDVKRDIGGLRHGCGMVIMDSMLDLTPSDGMPDPLWWSTVGVELRKLAYNQSVAIVVLAGNPWHFTKTPTHVDAPSPADILADRYGVIA